MNCKQITERLSHRHRSRTQESHVRESVVGDVSTEDPEAHAHANSSSEIPPSSPTDISHTTVLTEIASQVQYANAQVPIIITVDPPPPELEGQNSGQTEEEVGVARGFNTVNYRSVHRQVNGKTSQGTPGDRHGAAQPPSLIEASRCLQWVSELQKLRKPTDRRDNGSSSELRWVDRSRTLPRPLPSHKPSRVALSRTTSPLGRQTTGPSSRYRPSGAASLPFQRAPLLQAICHHHHWRRAARGTVDPARGATGRITRVSWSVRQCRCFCASQPHSRRGI